MRIVFFLLFLLFFNTGFTQECFPLHKKDKRLAHKIQKLIDKRAYYDAVDALQKTNEKAAIFYVL